MIKKVSLVRSLPSCRAKTSTLSQPYKLTRIGSRSRITVSALVWHGLSLREIQIRIISHVRFVCSSFIWLTQTVTPPRPGLSILFIMISVFDMSRYFNVELHNQLFLFVKNHKFEKWICNAFLKRGKHAKSTTKSGRNTKYLVFSPVIP